MQNINNENDVIDLNDEVELTELEKTGIPDQEEVIQNQEEMIRGLLAAADFAEDKDMQKLINIKRAGKLFFSFHIRPLSESELLKIRKQSTKMIPNPANRKLPKVEGELDLGAFRSRKIYAATTAEDKAKLWDNPAVKQGLNAKDKSVIETWEIVDKCLLAGEKDAISDEIDNLSGYNTDLMEYSKN